MKVLSLFSSSIFTPINFSIICAIKIDKRLIGHKVIKNKYANGAKKDNNVLGLLLNMTFGMNSPVNTTMIVDNTVFKRTCVTGE